MENLNLVSEIRTESGKGAAHRLRADGRVPAVLYGGKESPVSLTVNEAAIRTILHSHPESAIIELTVEGGGAAKPVTVIIRDAQRHPSTGRLLHVDFQRIRLDEKIRVEVRIAIQGDARGVKEQGGILEHGARSVNIMCLPTAIPESFDIDVTEFMIGDSCKLKDFIRKHPDIEFLDDPETNLAHVIPPIIEAKTAEEIEAEEEEEAEPELVAKEKEAEGEEATSEEKKSS
jgi:large subunit ribosomal protein L25